MNKPIKPKKPSKNNPAPTPIITVYKFLVKDSGGKFKLIDEVTDPSVFTDPDSGEINNELFAYWRQLEYSGYDHDLKRLSYSDYKLIFEQVPSDDFEVEHQYNRDGYYDCTYISYKIADPDYQTKLDKYHNRFTEYEFALKQYEKELAQYNEFKKEKTRQKLEQKLQSLNKP